ncbi:regulator of sigma E protease [Natranaerovirga pectinivora]|uniref:Zinc metalloprotease n=1 Tax=Natranaerovirga pectinivora TaxID=682400 RepID=A0A4R3MKR6_9FIRM|nr:RIP metalloprotease RseP [Natranaerovirga pectinivora]TCT15063.1 regulator of sigma E protease [Natranaerovirga pectinivora]
MDKKNIMRLVILLALIFLVPNQIIVAFLIFTLVVLVHEFGHFIVARKNGIFVEEFAIGMGPKVIGVKGKETLYSIRLLPLGGFCKMLGEDDEVEDERAFNKKSVLARMATIGAGPFFNFILAFIASLLVVGIFGFTDTTVYDVEPNAPAGIAGVQPGDTIVRINNKSVNTRNEINLFITVEQGRALDFQLERDGQLYNTTIQPVQVDTNVFLIGITMQSQRGNLLEVLQYGVYEFRYWVRYISASLRMIFTGNVGREDVAGPVGLVNFVSEGYQAGVQGGALNAIYVLLFFIILISFNLGVMNLLPIPALDGGRLIFLILEGIRGKPINRDKEGFIHFIGFAFLMVLMVFLLFNDIHNIRTR